MYEQGGEGLDLLKAGVCLYVCMCTYVYVCMCVYTCNYVYEVHSAGRRGPRCPRNWCVQVCMYMCVCVCVYIRVFMCVGCVQQGGEGLDILEAGVCMYVCICKYAYIYTCI